MYSRVFSYLTAHASRHEAAAARAARGLLMLLLTCICWCGSALLEDIQH
jgi:hypothetical protein